MRIRAFKSLAELYLNNDESNLIIKSNKRVSKNKPVIDIFSIWDFRTYKTQGFFTMKYS